MGVGGDAVLGLRAKLFALAALLATLRLASGCASPGCAPGASVEIHLNAGRPALDGGVLTLCVNGACNAGIPVWKPSQNGWESGQFSLVGDLPATATSATFYVTPDGRATISAGLTPQQQTGDGISIRFVDAQGTTLLDFSRGVVYHTDRGCLAGETRVWPSSPSALTCSARSCESGAEVATDVTLPDDSADGTAVEICRNDVCDSLVKVCRDPLCIPDFSSGFIGSLPAAMADGSLGGNSWGFRVSVRDDPAVLSDGDRYRLTITDRNGSILASVDRTVIYRQSYPNGTQCDPYPCRWAEVSE